MNDRSPTDVPTRDLWKGDGAQANESLSAANATCGDSFDQESAVEAIKALQRVERLVVSSDRDVDGLIGQTIGHYRIESLLGRGGMGKVYQAFQLQPVRRDVALKIMNLDVCGTPNSSQHARRRFIAEGQLLASLNHPDIASVFDADTTERGEPFFVMELASGVPLTKYCDDSQLRIEDRIKLVQRICRIVNFAHQKGIVHRDLKPDNILVAPGDEGPEVKIIDFGIAKVLEGHESIASGLTAQDAFIGTPGYLSPEQATGCDVDARADVFSLGAILFQLLCGSTPINQTDTPFKNFTDLRHLAKTYEAQRPSVRIASRDGQTQRKLADGCQTNVNHLLRQCRSDLDWVVLKALAPKRVDRYATALDFADDLQRVLDAEPTRAAAPTLVYRLQKFVQRHPLQAAAAAWTLVVLMFLLVRQQDLQHQRLVRTAAVARQTTRLMDQVVAIRQAIHSTAALPQSHLARAAVKLEQARELIAEQPSLDRAGARWQQLSRALADDEAAYDFVAALDKARQSLVFGWQPSKDNQQDDGTRLNPIALAFCDFGIGPAVAAPPIAAAKLEQLPPNLISHVIESLDCWMGETQSSSPKAAAQWQFDVLAFIDPSRERRHLRQAVLRNDAAELRLIAEQGIDQRYLPFSRVQLAGALAVAGHHPHALDVLRRAQQAHPENFWINHHLAVTLATRGDEESKEEALRFMSIATALRPDSAGPARQLVELLRSMGREEEARGQQRRADQLRPVIEALKITDSA